MTGVAGMFDEGASMRLWGSIRIGKRDEREREGDVRERWGECEGEADHTKWLVVIERAHANATIVVGHIVRIHKVFAHLRPQNVESRQDPKTWNHDRTPNVESRPAIRHQRSCVWDSARIFGKVARYRGRRDEIAVLGGHARRRLRADLEDLKDARLIRQLRLFFSLFECGRRGGGEEGSCFKEPRLYCP